MDELSYKFQDTFLIHITALVFLLIVGFVIWRVLFSPLRREESKLSVNLREKILPDVQKSAFSITSLSSAAIVLTFSVLQFFESEELPNIGLLKVSWIFFAGATLVGVLVGLASYVYRLKYLVMIKTFEDVREKDKSNEKISAEESALLTSSLQAVRFSERTLFIMLFSQPMFFGSGLLYFLAFALLSV